MYECHYCDRTFDSQYGCMVHKRSCKKTEVVYEAPKKSGACYRCGRTGHYSSDCYASTHKKGYELWHETSDESEDEESDENKEVEDDGDEDDEDEDDGDEDDEDEDDEDEDDEDKNESDDEEYTCEDNVYDDTESEEDDN